MTLVDTDILIWFLRGNSKAARFLDKQEGFSISAVTYMELVQGMRNKEELQILRNTIKDWEIKTLHIDSEICAKAMYYVEEHFLNHRLRLADALIAATAVKSSLKLATGNMKHYKMIKDLAFQQFKAD